MFVRDRAQGERIALAALLPAIPLFLGGCIITLDLPEGTPENHEGETPALPSTTLPDGKTPAPGDKGPALDETQQAKRAEVDAYIAHVLYDKATVVASLALPSGDVVDFLDRSTLPAVPYALPALPLTDADLTLPDGVTSATSELLALPALPALAAKATPFHRPTFWPYILGATDATSLEDYLARYTLGGQPTSSEHLYAGLATVAPNRGLSGSLNQFRPEVAPGSFSLIEFAVACPATGTAQEAVGFVISVDKVNPFGMKGQPLADGEPRMHIEIARRDPTTGETRYTSDGSQGEFKANPLRKLHRPGETVPVSVLGGAQVEHLAAIFQSPTNDWWIAYQGELLGYYPAGLFHQLNGGACRVQWYGEVARRKPASTTAWPRTEMGSGRFAVEGLRNAAYVRNPRYYDAFWFGVEPLEALSVDLPNQPSCYTRGLLKSTTQGDKLFFLGGPGGKDSGCVGP
jgi:Neprosin